MGLDTAIAWTDHTFNLAWGCVKVSPGCANCYADTLSDKRGYDVWGPNRERRTFGDTYWNQPRLWNRSAIAHGVQRRVFCSSMTDVMLDDPVLDRERRKLWPLIRETPALDWLLLTKRPENYRRFLPDDWGDGYANVWLGTSIESNDYADRADELRAVPARLRFISYEPALGPLDKLNLAGLDWVIYGGESGPGYRQHDPQWARDIRARCEAAGVVFFFKQAPAYRTEQIIELDGEVVRAWPESPAYAKRLPVLGQLFSGSR